MWLKNQQKVPAEAELAGWCGVRLPTNPVLTQKHQPRFDTERVSLRSKPTFPPKPGQGHPDRAGPWTCPVCGTRAARLHRERWPHRAARWQQPQRVPHRHPVGQENTQSAGGARTSRIRGGNETHRKDKTTVGSPRGHTRESQCL